MSQRRWSPGRDSRAVRHRGPAGAVRLAEEQRRSALVLGGGIAGLAAATALAERGVLVRLVERESQLGGRVAAWPVRHGADLVTMSRGFHAFFRQYYNLRALLRRTDPTLSRLVAVSDYPLIAADGMRDSFARIPRTPPLSIAAFVAQSPSFSAADLARVDVTAALELLAVEFPATFEAYDGESAAAFLDRLRFPPAARHLALEVFARSFFAHPGEFSAGELVAMFHTYFLGSAEGLLFDVPDDDYDTALWSPLARYLTRLGVVVETGVAAEQISTGQISAGQISAGQISTGQISAGGEVRVETSAGVRTADGLVIAVDPRATRELVAASESVGDPAWRAHVAGGRNAPPFGVLRLWLDRPVAAERPAFLGTSGFGPLDNITVLERFEAGAAGWAREHGGSVVELHAYAVAEPVDGPALRARLVAELNGIYPETKGARALAEEWLLRDDCPLVGTGPWHLRPGVATRDPRVVLAGDGVRCDYPVALMERAATTGFLAANRLLAGWGLAGHDVWTVPMRGRHALTRTAARLGSASRRRSRPQPGYSPRSRSA